MISEELEGSDIMSSIGWAILIAAGSIILYIVLKPRLTAGFMLRIVANLALSATAIYIVQWTGVLGDLSIPVNIPSVLIGGLLGLPGAAVLVGIHVLVLT